MRRLATAGVAAFALTGCFWTGPSLTAPGTSSVVEGAARVHEGDTVVIGSMFACLNKPGTVKVLAITAVHPVGLKVTGWAVHPNSGGQTGVARDSLADLGLTSSGRIGPRATCGHHGQGDEFMVEVEKTTSGEAGAHAWTATYESDGQRKTFTWPLTVLLCNEMWTHAKPCQALKP